MNRLFIIVVDTLEIRGVVSPAELPEVVSDFYRRDSRKLMKTL